MFLKQIKYVEVIFLSAILIAFSSIFVRAESYEDFTYSIDDNEVMISRYTGTSERIEIPESLDGFPVTAIGDGAFFNCNSLVSIKIPEGVTSIGKRAFLYCSSLEAIHIPPSVERIEEMAFWGCSSLDRVVIPKGVTEIKHRTFYECTSLTRITIPASVTSIMSDAFEYCPVTIYGNEGAYSESFAVENQINYIVIKNTDVTKPTIETPFIIEHRFNVVDIRVI